jgi:hypothetical protein
MLPDCFTYRIAGYQYASSSSNGTNASKLETGWLRRSMSVLDRIGMQLETLQHDSKCERAQTSRQEASITTEAQ